jgi:molecular chaperone GrpE
MTTIKDDQKAILEEETKEKVAGNGTEPQELTLEDQLAVALEESAKNLEGWKRSMADYQNLKKEMEERYQELIKYANAGLLDELATVLENFQVALDHLPQDLESNSWVQGIVCIHKQMQEVLTQKGVEFIEPKVGDEFDPNLHEAIETNEEQVKDPDTEGKITKVLRKGLSLNGRLIRSARVNVG